MWLDEFDEFDSDFLWSDEDEKELIEIINLYSELEVYSDVEEVYDL